ncbi:MAG TPA: type II toxin-antitoxin system RelE/ParE family toxin [Candidatus Paceibacterota bacterium]
MEIRNFDDSIEKFIEALERQTIAKVFRAIDLLEGFGPRLGMPHSKKIDHDLFELRIRGVQEVRIFYTVHRTSIVLLHGFVKKSQKTPKKEIRTAVQRIRALD